MKSLTAHIALFLTIVWLLCGCRCTAEPPEDDPTPPPADFSGQRLFLERGLIEGEEGTDDAIYYIETPAGARVPPPEPGTEFVVAHGSDGVTLVQVAQGLAWVWAEGEWVAVNGGQQSFVWPGRVPEAPSELEQLLDRESYLADPVLGD